MISNLLYLALLSATLVAFVLGILVIFQAYRGYRRNNSSRMLYLSIGLAFITIGPFALSLVFTATIGYIGFESVVLSLVLPLVTRAFEIFGLVLILYSLYRN